jgi:hypothetical protein
MDSKNCYPKSNDSILAVADASDDDFKKVIAREGTLLYEEP